MYQIVLNVYYRIKDLLYVKKLSLAQLSNFFNATFFTFSLSNVSKPIIELGDFESYTIIPIKIYLHLKKYYEISGTFNLKIIILKQCHALDHQICYKGL